MKMGNKALSNNSLSRVSNPIQHRRTVALQRRTVTGQVVLGCLVFRCHVVDSSKSNGDTGRSSVVARSTLGTDSLYAVWGSYVDE